MTEQKKWMAYFTSILMITIALTGAYSETPSVPINPLSSSGIIGNWGILGPFPNPQIETDEPEGITRSGFSTDYLTAFGGEASAQLTLETTVPYFVESGKSQTAKAMLIQPNSNGRMDFLSALKTENANYQVIYAFCTVESECDQKVFCYLGSDDSARVWIEGTLVLDHWLPEGRGCSRGEDRFEANLKKGLNRILIKVENYTGPWGLLFEMFTEKDHASRQKEIGSPEDFTRFSFKDNEKQAYLLNRYLWYFFSKRAINPKASFEQEYLTVSDMWLAGAYDPHSSARIQNIHRDHLLTIEMDEEGYVHTHQHFSHCHEHGWPFPLWAQIQGGSQGYTYGWHFQDQGMGWLWQFNLIQAGSPHTGISAAESWELKNLQSSGIRNSAWQLKATGPSPMMTSAEGIVLDAFNVPYLQLRWKRTGEPAHPALPYIEWQREEDSDWGPDRRYYFEPKLEEHSSMTGMFHSMIPVYKHPKWSGKIKRVRIALAPGESDIEFSIDSFFAHYDTRHSINNPLLILGSWAYFRWTGDIDFLRKNINRLRRALKYQQTEMGGLEFKHIRNTWPGHDGLPGWVRNSDGTKTSHPGHGIGNNYWDLMPFGWDDLYATSQYYKSTLALAKMEELIRQNPGWGVPLGAESVDPDVLRVHAAEVKKTANEKFWNPETGRFYASIDKNGTAYDYGYTFLNLESIWYGLASNPHAIDIMDWISAKRIVEGDTSKGNDIYHWQFGPRATTKRNLDWYGQGWTAPESIAWGGQVQDGGAVLGFTFFDLWSRLQVLGPDDAWQRLMEIIEWEEEVQEAGGYRAYYADGKQGTTLQGGGTAGGLGIDHEFLESSLLPAIIPLGFLGLHPDGVQLSIHPQLPTACPEMGIENLFFKYCPLDISVSSDTIVMTLKEEPIDSIRIALPGKWKMLESLQSGSEFELFTKGTYRLNSVID